MNNNFLPSENDVKENKDILSLKYAHHELNTQERLHSILQNEDDSYLIYRYTQGKRYKP